jgi:hypothetical protein
MKNVRLAASLLVVSIVLISTKPAAGEEAIPKGKLQNF